MPNPALNIGQKTKLALNIGQKTKRELNIGQKTKPALNIGQKTKPALNIGWETSWMVQPGELHLCLVSATAATSKTKNFGASD